jgi:hypothetical protein
MLWKIISKVQGSNSTAARDLVKDIISLRLTKEPGMDVDQFCLKLHPKCILLHGLGENYVPFDFSVLVSACFDTTGMQPFDLTMSNLANEIDDDETSHSWTDILDTAQRKFDTMKNTNRWTPLYHAPNPKLAESGFAVQLQSLSSKVDSIFKGGASTAGGSRKVQFNKVYTKDTSKDTSCRYCKETSHIIDNCPTLATKNGSPPPVASKPKTTWTRTAPATGASESKSVSKDGATTVYKWCGTCKRWRCLCSSSPFQ